MVTGSLWSRSLRTAWVGLALAAAVLSSPRAFADSALRLIVETGSAARSDCPVTVSLPKDVARVARNWQLFEVRDSGSHPIPCQFLGDESTVVAWILAGETPAKTVRTFELRPAATDASSPARISARRDDRTIDVQFGERPVLRYHVARVDPPPDIDSKYGRSGHIHPLWTPQGLVVTDEFPPDHPHQDGVFLAYVKTEFEGRSPDFWNLLGGTGFVRCAEVRNTFDGPICAGFRVRHEHVDNAIPGGKVALSEEWDVTVWRPSGGARGYRFDVTSRIVAASESPLLIKEFHYGGMAFRGARAWAGDQALFTTADGKSREAGNHARVPWVDLSGPIGEGTAGVTVFTDSANFRFPEPVRLHPTMPYFVFTPAVLGDWSIVPGKPHFSRYHYHVHDGGLVKDDAERLWRDISDPPRVAVRSVANEP